MVSPLEIDTIVDASKHKVTCKELVFLIANRVYFSRGYAFFYAGMVLLNVTALVWMIATQGYPGNALFTFLEVCITVALLLEVSMKMITQRKSYFHRPSNWFDLVVVAMSIAALFIYVEGPSQFEQVDEFLSTSLIVVRYIIQSLRLYILIRHQKMMDQLTGNMQHTADDIDFSTIEDPDVDMFDRSKGDFSASLRVRIPVPKKRAAQLQRMHLDVANKDNVDASDSEDHSDSDNHEIVDDTATMLDRIISSSNHQNELQLL